MTQDDRSSRTPEDGSEAAPAEAEQPTPTPGKAEREHTFTRRALLQAGWTAPVIIAATMPETAYAQTPHTDHNDIHSDVQPAPHGDVTHTDSHSDSHTDGHGDFTDAPQDIPIHTDITHTDGHGDAHTDIPHTDTP